MSAGVGDAFGPEICCLRSGREAHYSLHRKLLRGLTARFLRNRLLQSDTRNASFGRINR